MTFKRLSRSIRKFIRLEKARIRREVFDKGEAKRKIQELVGALRQRYNVPTRPEGS